MENSKVYYFKSIEHLLSQKCITSLNKNLTENIVNNLTILVKLYDKNFLINRKWCMLKTLIENDVTEISWEILFKRSENMKNDSCSLDGLVLKYGSIVGEKLFKERRIKVSVTKESYTKNHTVEEWNDLCDKKKSNLGEDGYIKKYGELEGKKKWDLYLKKWKKSMAETTLLGRKNGLSLIEMQEKHGIEAGYDRWKKRIDSRKYTLSLNGFIERFGKEGGVRKYYSHIDKMVSNCRKLGGFSKISQKLFDDIHSRLEKSHQDSCKYHTKSGEEKFYVTETTEMKMMFVDFKCGNVIIEFDGDYWHSIQYTQTRDIIKQKILEDRGYKVLRIKELHYKTNKEKITQECLDFIKKHYERT